MKKSIQMILAVILMAVLLSAVSLAAEEKETQRIILYTCYQNVFPDGVALEAGCVDEEGNLWIYSGTIPDRDHSVPMDEYLATLIAEGTMTNAGQMSWDDLFELNSLIFSVEDQGAETEAVFEGGGAESSYAVVYIGDEPAQRILLGVSGDSRFENTDPNAQALYLRLRELFPDVTNYFGGDAGPRGFQTVSLVEFMGWQDIDFTRVVITGWDMDCEAGPIPFELSEENAEEIIQFILNNHVTGKANATMVTGGTTEYIISDENGNYLAALELYEGLLVRNDGMYHLSR